MWVAADLKHHDCTQNFEENMYNFVALGLLVSQSSDLILEIPISGILKLPLIYFRLQF